MRQGKPRVSLAMVVKNEAAGIRRAIESVAPLVDEIVVHDTGSTDGTQDIVRELGGRVIEEPWRADFSYHRNLVLGEARGDWVIMIDGDEYLRDPADLRETIDNAWRAKFDAVFTYVQSVGDGDVLGERERQIRAWDRHRCRYKFPIHNQLYGWRPEKVVTCQAVVWAYYLGTLEDRFERTVPPLKRMLEDNEPRTEPHMHALCFLARAYSMMNRHEEAREYARALCDQAPDRLGFANIWAILVRSTLATKSIAEGEQVIEEALSHHGAMADIWWWKSVVTLKTWAACARPDNPYLFVPQFSLRYIPNLGDAGPILGMAFMRKRADDGE